MGVIEEVLAHSLAHGEVVRIETHHPEGDAMVGVVAAVTSALVVLVQVHNFEEDGYAVCPRRWIRDVRHGRFEQGATSVVRFLGGLKPAGPSAWFEGATDLREIATRLRRDDLWPAIEVISEGASISYLGQVDRVAETTMALNCYDAAGVWEDPYTLELEEIFKLEVNCRYARNLNAYVRATTTPR